MFNKKEEIISCRVCKCLVKKSDAETRIHKKLEINFLYIQDIPVYFCPAHAPKYDSFTERLVGSTYERLMRVDKNGEPIGYKKI